MTLPINTIVCGSALEVMAGWPADSVNCCISSPPYWALRDYGVDGQFGLEKTFEEYIDKLCNIYDEVKRVLRPDGTCWVNLGDTYSQPNCRRKSPDETVKNIERAREKGYNVSAWGFSARAAEGMDRGANKDFSNIPAKSLCLIPQRFAIEMVNRGWILRNKIIWHKPNPMPSSAKDRFTVDFEYVYFFVKNKQYWFETQYEPMLTESNAERPRMGQGNQTKYKQKRAEGMGGAGTSWKGHSGNLKADGSQIGNPTLGRNKRTVWTIPTQPFPEAHFATYPEKLVEPMIKAGCPEFICVKCGKAREKIIDITYEKVGSGTCGGRGRFGPDDKSGFTGKPTMRKIPTEKGYTDCGCNAGWRPGVVWDPFVERARPVWLLPGTDGTGSGLNSKRNISRWRCAA